MALRAAHGARREGGPRIEVMPADEQPKAQAAGPDPISSGRDSLGKIRSSDAARAMAKLPRRSRFMPRKLACDPRFAPHNARRLEWQRKRLAELATAHGHADHSVGAMVNAAGWGYAAGEFAAELAAETGDLDLFKTAAHLTSVARQNDMAAWEMCARAGERFREQAKHQLDGSKVDLEFLRELKERNAREDSR